jgi:predicted metal-dependent enzyme (double-stranded beta helix superfamily)
MTSPDALSWRAMLDLISGMQRDEVTEDLLHGLVKRLVVDAALLAPYIQFNQGGYARNVLFRDDKFEAICLCWEPGQYTAVHNHGGSFGVVYVYEGELDVTTYRRVDDGSVEGECQLENIGDYAVPAGGLLLDRRPSIHRLGNAPDATRRAVSLHFYAGPLDVMEIFDVENGKVGKKPMTGEPMLYIEPEAHIMAAMI